MRAETRKKHKSNIETGERLLIDRTIAIFGLFLVAIPVVAEPFIGRREKSLMPKERAAWQAERDSW
jgi:hypothetical protein